MACLRICAVIQVARLCDLCYMFLMCGDVLASTGVLKSRMRVEDALGLVKKGQIEIGNNFAMAA
jgi:hypothetical protein